MPSYTNKAINTNEMQKWRNAINPDSVSQITNLVNQKANQSDLITTNENVNGLTSNLASMTTVQDESALLGSELLDGTGWVSTGWSGNFTNGFINPVGNTQPLSRPLSTGGGLYQVTFTINSPTGNSDFTVQLGNSYAFTTYQGSYNTFTYTYGIRSINDGSLVFTPITNLFDGTITNISVKQIIGTANPTNAIKDSTNNNAFEMRPTTSALDNIFIGKSSGQYNTTGHENVSIGGNNMSANTTGFWNTAVGKDALSANTVGSRNVALGYLALNTNIDGHRNIAIGSYALTRNTDGYNNIALGADSLWYNTTGNGNVALGQAALGANTTGADNIALGTGAAAAVMTGIQNIAIGRSALNQSTDSNSIAIGRGSLFSSKTGTNIAMGYYALNTNVTGTYNVGMGHTALQNSLGGYNIALGYQAGLMAVNSSANSNILIGDTTGKVLTTGGDYNVIVGCGSGYSMTNGTRNVVVGPSSGASVTTGSKNILIGWSADVANPTDTLKMNIGNALYGDLTTKYISIGMPTDTSTDAFMSGLALQVGKTTSKGKVDLRFGTNTSDTDLGGLIFGNLNNLNTTGTTRAYVAAVVGTSTTANSNVNGDSGGYLRFFTKGDVGGFNENMRLDSKGNLGIGLTAPTAKLHLRGGTATAGTAPLKLTAGTNLTTPESGAFEFDGTNLYFTINGVRKTIQVA